MRPYRKNVIHIIIAVALYFAQMASISAFFRDDLLLTLLSVIICGAGFILWHERGDMISFAAGAVLGPGGEIVYVHFGAWQYANPSFLGIPVWLILGWGLAVMLVKRFSESLVRIMERSPGPVRGRS